MKEITREQLTELYKSIVSDISLSEKEINTDEIVIKAIDTDCQFTRICVSNDKIGFGFSVNEYNANARIIRLYFRTNGGLFFVNYNMSDEQKKIIGW